MSGTYDLKINKQEIETDIPMLDLELVRGCNMHCRWCPVDKNQPVRYMELSLFERLVREAILHRIGYQRFSVFLGGDPLLHPQFGKALQILRDSGYREANYRKIQIFTNGVALTRERSVEIVQTDVLNRISVSVDGVGDSESFAYMRPPSRLEEVVQNVRRFMLYHAEAKSSLDVVIASIIPYAGQVPFEVPSLETIQNRFIKIFGPFGIKKFEYRFLRDEYNNPDWKMAAERNPDRPCYLAKDRKLVVQYNGNISSCSKHLNGENTIGQVRTMGLLSAWNRPDFRQMRYSRSNGDFKYRADLCQNCDCGSLQKGFRLDPCEYGINSYPREEFNEAPVACSST